MAAAKDDRQKGLVPSNCEWIHPNKRLASFVTVVDVTLV